jgi:NitT/TauT family transport system ATP-binding protein
MQDEIIRFDHVRFGFDHEVVFENLSFAIGRGEFVCLLGPSGCGKSTLLRLIGDLLRPAGGTITVDGHDPRDSWQKLAFVFQSPRLAPWRTAFDNVLLGLELRGGAQSRAEMRHQATRALELVGLTYDANKYPRMLSGGGLQRVAIARALAVEPQIILMDEPFSALDPNTRKRMRAEIIAIWQQTKKTIVFVTHDVEEALVLADRVFLLSKRPARLIKTISIKRPRPRFVADDPDLRHSRNELMTLFAKLEVDRDLGHPPEPALLDNS